MFKARLINVPKNVNHFKFTSQHNCVDIYDHLDELENLQCDTTQDIHMSSKLYKIKVGYGLELLIFANNLYSLCVSYPLRSGRVKKCDHLRPIIYLSLLHELPTWLLGS